MLRYDLGFKLGLRLAMGLGSGLNGLGCMVSGFGHQYQVCTGAWGFRVLRL